MNEIEKYLCEKDSYHAINDVLNEITLHDRQCVDIVKFLYAERSMFLYDTGTGKTLIAAAIMKMLKHANPGMFSVMIVLKDQLLQTPDKLKRYADLRVLTTYADSTYVGKNFINQNLTDYDVVMITEECLLNKKVMDYLYSYRDKMISVIIDEAHKLNNFNSARSASMLRALLSKVRYTCALTATPIVTSSFQLSRLAHLLRPERYPNPKRLAQDLESKRFSIEQDPFFFINRKASEFGRTSTPNGHVIAVSPSPSQSECNCGGVKLFQICKGYGAVNQVQALEELVNEHRDAPGLIFISQGSIIEWVSANFKKNEIDFEVIDGETSIQDRTRITSRFASGDCKLVIASLTTALDLDCDYVVFYEFTVEVEQMIGRAHRGLGNKELDVYFIITENTPEITYFMENIVPRCKLIEDILSKKNTAIEAVTRGLELEC